MKIESLTIKAQASANYQVGAAEITISDYTEEELFDIEGFVIDRAVVICKELNNVLGASNVKPAVQTQRVQNTAPQAPRQQIPQIPRAPQQIRPSMVSEKQRKVLTKAGYSAEQIDHMTSKEAAKAIEEYWVRTGYNKPQAPVAPQPAYQPEYQDDTYYGYDE